MVDVTLTGTDWSLVALIEPRLSDANRLGTLRRTFTLPTATPHELLRDLIEDPDDRWRRPWLSACAIYAAWSISEVDVSAITDAASGVVAGAAISEESSAVAETLAAIRDGRIKRTARR